ncbi:MAG: AI-2E family transporter [Crocosphaera sp.]
MNSWLARPQKILITWLLILVTGWLTVKTLSYIGGLISLVLTASLIAFLLNYPVRGLKAIIPRSLAATFVYIGAILIVILLAITLLPPVVNQGRQLIIKLPTLLEEVQQQLVISQGLINAKNLPIDLEFLTSQIITKIEAQTKDIASTGFGLVLGTFNWFIDLIVLIVISFYMLLDGERIWKGLMSFFSPKIRGVLTTTLEKNLQRFFTGQLLLGLFMAVTLTMAFSLLGIPFFLLFAVFIGVMEILPFIGATLGIGTVTIILAFINWWLAVQVLVVAVIIQQIKDNLVAPKIMGNLTGLPPVVIFIALLVGAKIGGLLGVILAIPITGVIKGLTEILGDPSLPPQTGSLFYNPFSKIGEEETSEQLVGKTGD